MLFNKRSIGTLLIYSLTLAGCETTNPTPQLNIKAPFSSLKSNKQLSAPLTQILQLLQEEKYSEASSVINQALQAQPKSIALHLLNGLT